MKFKTSLSYLISFALGVADLSAQEYRFFDGNGNLFLLGRENPLSLDYDPITPMESSSGIYSGGKKKSVVITKKQNDVFLSLVSESKSLKQSMSLKKPKGTKTLIWKEKGKLKEILFPSNSVLGNKIESHFKECLKNENTIVSGKTTKQMKFSISRTDNPWAGMTGSWEEEEANKHILSIKIPAKDFKPIVTPNELLWSTEPTLYRNEELKQVAVNSKFFSNLERIDVTRIKKGESLPVGSVNDNSLFNPTFLIPFLIKGQILISYWHTDAEIEFVKETTNKTLSCHHFKGEHHYYTNEKNSSRYEFQICLDSNTKQITIVGN